MPVDSTPSFDASRAAPNVESLSSCIELVQKLRNELDRQHRRMQELRIEAEGLRDWAEALEAELNSLKRSFWYRFLMWNR
jgi:predicted  nucleic acid-binding Zn-ribbon protein